jgi:hypothetical protein
MRSLRAERSVPVNMRAATPHRQRYLTRFQTEVTKNSRRYTARQMTPEEMQLLRFLVSAQVEKNPSVLAGCGRGVWH